MANKVLYFEGAGMNGTGQPVGNCRIRTAFTNDKGIRYYLELGGNELSQQQRKYLDPYGEYKNEKCMGWVDFCHEIPDEGTSEACNTHRHAIDHGLYFHWTLEGIKQLINEHLECSFDKVEVAPEFSGYRVFRERWVETPESYDYGDEFEIDWESTKKVEEIYKHEYQRQKDAGEKYPCVSVYRDKEDQNLVHVVHFHKCGFENFNVAI